jgi:Histidine kinase-, DNA gyrase B-, and HSP90-like ATPase
MTQSEPTYAIAEPTKRLFLSLLTRDISLEHAILDLIDNSINSAIRVRNLNLVESFDDFVSGQLAAAYEPSDISIRFSVDEFEIADECGGIPLQAAKTTVFRFGRDETSAAGDVLSVYGVGLKRALFKIADHIQVWSQDDENAFIVEDHAADWASRQEVEWRFPLRELPRDASRSNGTRILLRDILPAMKEALSAPSFEEKLIRR